VDAVIGCGVDALRFTPKAILLALLTPGLFEEPYSSRSA
jgi:branched-subunit amino acid transport protein